MSDLYASPESIDREEKARAQFQAIQAKRNANRLKVASFGAAPYSKRRGRNVRHAQIRLDSFQLIQSPAAIGDFVRRRLLSNARALAFRTENMGIVHVKNGEPLTPEGERLTGKKMRPVVPTP